MEDVLDQVLEKEEDTQKDRYLTFSIGREYYGIEIKYVTEIIGLQVITEIPQQADFVKGIINLRGKIIPVIDVRLRFKKESIAYNDRTCIIVIDVSDSFIGLIVDTVAEVLSIPEQDIALPQEIDINHQNKYIKGIGKVGEDVKLLVDCAKIIQD